MKNFAAELRRLKKEKIRHSLNSSVYSGDVVIPLLFNSDCAIGKRGMTCIEIAEGYISLLHFFEESRPPKYLDSNMLHKERFPHTSYFTVCLKSQTLSDIFTRIELLS